MHTIIFQGVRVEIDADKAQELRDINRDPCQCDSCTNADLVRRRFTPEEQVEMLTLLGLDPWSPASGASDRRRPFDPPEFTRRTSCWLLYGRILGADRTPKLLFDRSSWMWIDTSRAAVPRGAIFEAEQTGADIIYVIASNALPVLYRQVAGFRSDYVAIPCPQCGDRWRMTGYLKRRSLIPEWLDLPELAALLRRRDIRVYVEFCAKCGHLDYRLTARKPPFRVKNNLLRQERKDMRTRFLRAIRPQTFRPVGRRHGDSTGRRH